MSFGKSVKVQIVDGMSPLPFEACLPGSKPSYVNESRAFSAGFADTSKDVAIDVASVTSVPQWVRHTNSGESDSSRNWPSYMEVVEEESHSTAFVLDAQAQ